MKLLGKPVAEQIEKEEIIPNLQKLASEQPHLAILLVGDDHESEIYVQQKEKTGKRLGIGVSVYRLDQTAPIDEIKDIISFLNDDDEINGIIIQLPLPKNLKSVTQELLDLIDPAKDVDALTTDSAKSSISIVSSFTELKSAYQAKKLFLPPTASAALEIIDFYQIPFQATLLIGRGILVGSPVAKMLNEMQVKYQVIHSQIIPENQQKLLKKAQLIISGTNSQKPIFGPSDVKSDAVIIDCAADFDHDICRDTPQRVCTFKGSITPAIGGIGPVTVYCLLRNVVYASIWQNKI